MYRLQNICLVLAVSACAVWAQTGSAVAVSVHLAVTGDVPKTLSLSAQDLAAYHRRSLTVREHNGSTATYEGVPVIEILKAAGAPSGPQLKGKALASYVLASARDGYAVTFTLAELDPEIGSGDVIVADRRDGKPLSDELGPLRLISASDKKPARSVRMLETLQLVLLRKDERSNR